MKLRKSIISGTVASALLFSLAAPTAFANEDVAEQPETGLTVEEVSDPVLEDSATEEVLVEEETTSYDEGTEEAEKVVEEGLEENSNTEDVATEEEDQTEEPTLVPGDFFYFVKIMMEKVRLAVSFDDYKEARLLADFAAERIAEANALIADGKTEEAEEVLNKAIATQEEAAENLAESVEVADEETDAVEVVAEDVVVEDIEEDVVEVKLANNIDALSMALTYVENPNAQKALRKNIEKSFAKLDKKLAKLEKKAAKFSSEEGVEVAEEPTEEPVVEQVMEETEPVIVDPVVEEPIVEEEGQPVVSTPVVEKQQKSEEKRAQGQKAEGKQQEAPAKQKEQKQKENHPKQNANNKNAEKKNEKGSGNGNGKN
ncbi:DUF5667 domain-containing protein [Mesobacillus maritimus]|uniref:DUF5667 domain-containing protein n=1 Tax=Mesobacillus maritimus TaxID=1643336 RepID=UPI00384B91E5